MGQSEGGKLKWPSFTGWPQLALCYAASSSRQLVLRGARVGYSSDFPAAVFSLQRPLRGGRFFPWSEGGLTATTSRPRFFGARVGHVVVGSLEASPVRGSGLTRSLGPPVDQCTPFRSRGGACARLCGRDTSGWTGRASSGEPAMRGSRPPGVCRALDMLATWSALGAVRTSS